MAGAATGDEGVAAECRIVARSYALGRVGASSKLELRLERNTSGVGGCE